ncbi:MAG TPA: helical backbone metal receptor [Trebonia sp.]|nr:helical backbone metal receptor [Trebonia sp.]
MNPLKHSAPVAVLAVSIALAALTALTACGSSAGSSASPASSARSSVVVSASASTRAPSPGAFPITVKTTTGLVTISAAPKRIVSLSPTATEDLYADGAGPQVVAVDETSDYPPGVPKTTLNGTSPNIEAIAGYDPSLVIAAEDTGGLVAGLKKLGVPVLIEPAAATLAAAYAEIEQIGQATGHAAQADTVITGMEAQIAADLKKAGTTHSDLSYFWEVSASPYYSATSQTIFGEIAGMFGLKNIADKVATAASGGYPELTEEYIVASKPQIIFLTDNDPGDGGQTPAIVAARPGWAGLPAVKNHEIIALNDDVAARWGPRLPQLVAAIAAAVESASAASAAS